MDSTPFFDLHMHTLHSDGELSPENLIELAAQRGVRVLAITDHDTLEAIPAAQAHAARFGIEVIPGIELSVAHAEGELHLLGYFIRRPEVMNEALQALRTSRVGRAKRIIERLHDLGVPIEYEAVRSRARGSVIGRPHIAEVLVETGRVASFNDAFERYLGNGRPAYVANRTLSLAEGVQLLRAAGGVPSIAHPHVNQCEQLVGVLAAEGVLGLEVWHPAHDPAVTEYYLQEAGRHGLVPTGGSDFHRQSVAGILPGDIGLTPERLEAVRALAG